MISIKTTLLSFVFFVSPVALASDWQLIDADNSTEYYMDFASVASSGKYVKVWIGTQYKTPQKTSSVPATKYGSEKTLVYFSCKEKTFSISTTLYYGLGKFKTDVVDSIQGTFNPTRLSDVAPDSIGEQMLVLACNPAARAERKKMMEKVKKIVDEVRKEHLLSK